MKLEGMSLASMGTNRKITERDMYRFLARKHMRERKVVPPEVQKQLSQIKEEEEQAVMSPTEQKARDQEGGANGESLNKDLNDVIIDGSNLDSA